MVEEEAAMPVYRATVCLLFVLGLILSSQVRADDDDDHDDDDDRCEETEIQIRGPLDSVDLETTPATVTIYGITIDVTDALQDEHEDLCGCLKAGSWVKIKLASDTEPLVATKIQLKGGYDSKAWIKAPLQAIDATVNTLTVLGVTIDVSSENSKAQSPIINAKTPI
jgi:hypothetical protein